MLCDGSKSIETIIDEFAEQYSLTFHESRVLITGFIKMLVQRGALAMEMGKKT
jgi:hypothetical protein